jgi:hypothetical protein
MCRAQIGVKIGIGIKPDIFHWISGLRQAWAVFAIFFPKAATNKGWFEIKQLGERIALSVRLLKSGSLICCMPTISKSKARVNKVY